MNWKILKIFQLQFSNILVDIILGIRPSIGLNIDNLKDINRIKCFSDSYVRYVKVMNKRPPITPQNLFMTTTHFPYLKYTKMPFF